MKICFETSVKNLTFKFVSVYLTVPTYVRMFFFWVVLIFFCLRSSAPAHGGKTAKATLNIKHILFCFV